jgi:general nucleoside transport system ATP-binding protein
VSAEPRSALREGSALALLGISKRFGGALALDGADLRVRTGTIHALLGENGAGKTTLMRIAFGLVRPDTGSIRVRGQSVMLRSPADAIAAGVGMVHQHYTTVAAMSVLENVALGGRGRFDASQAAARVRALGAQVGLDIDPDARVGELSVSAQQRVEILKAVARDATLLILDEPTAVLAPAEADELLRWLRRFADDGGTVVLITHKLAEAVAWADDVTVLRAGRTVLSGPRGEASIESIATAMLGASQPTSRALRGSGAEGAVVARATRLTIRDTRGLTRIQEASFEVRAGEIVGVAGVDGAGHSELLRALARRLPISSGSLMLPGSIAFVPEDRQRDALLLDFSLTENVALGRAGTRRGLVPWKALAHRTGTLLSAFDVRGGTPGSYAAALSGGNQQRLVLARELDGSPELVVAMDPTRGLDIRAAAAVQDRLRAARDSGAAVVVYSSDLDEVIGLASRVLVVHQGRVSEQMPDRATVGAAMLGLDA